jgi:hypothetical protein
MSQTIVNTNVEIVECPICMDEINGEKNKVTTECGHCFHTSCLMKNVAHNGFGCPYCRDAMAEEVESDEEYDEFSIDEEEGPDYNDNVLRGARWLFQRAEGEEVDDDEDSVLDEEEERVEVEPRAPVDYIVEKLTERGVSMADLVKAILIRDHDEYQFHDEFDRVDDELFGKFRIIISNYQPEDPVPVLEESSHHQSSRLRQQDSVEESDYYPDESEEVVEKTVWPVKEAMSLLHRGPIRKGITVDKNDPDFEKFSQYCDIFYSSQRVTRYERMAAQIEEEKEEASDKIPFPFKIKGSCVPNEVA